MKTLDEVIKANECCDHGDLDSKCEDCPYNGIGACCWERESDALQYLKAFRDVKDTLEREKDRYAEAIKNCEQAKNKYRKAEQDALKALDDWASRPVEENKKLVLTVDNPPLTWDELHTMEEKPVWIDAESLPVGVFPYWKNQYIIKSFSNDEFIYCNDSFEWVKENTKTIIGKPIERSENNV